jgi:sulfide dehydrogenase cytochrome subunit
LTQPKAGIKIVPLECLNETIREERVSRQWFNLGAAVMAVALVTGTAAAADPMRIALVTGACTGCHGQTGEGGHGVPSIAGTKSRAEFIAIMQGFREGRWTAPPTVMDRIARGYRDEEFALMAARFARPD